MGCGKSSVGRKLSELLCCRFMDLDSVIEEREGRSIPEIFASDGEAAFRNIEKTVLSDVLHVTMPKCSRGPLPLRGPRPVLLPQAARCKSPLDYLPSRSRPLAGGGKMPLPHNRHTPHETHLCKEMLILALGGGTVMTPECAELVHGNTLCIYLKASLETLVAHLESEASRRPLLSGTSLRERISELMALRSSTYENTAHVIIDTDGRSIDSIAQEIMQQTTPVHRVRGDL